MTTINHGAFKDCAGLKTVTIPRGVSSVANSAFEGCTGLIVRGETGTEAHRFARENGFAFEAVDDGKADFEVTWKESVYANTDITFNVKVKNAESVQVFLDGQSIGWFNEGKSSGFSVKHKVEQAGDYTLYFRAQNKKGQYLYSDFLPLKVEARGPMEAIENITLTAYLGTVGEDGRSITVEWGTSIDVTAVIPKGHRYVSRGFQWTSETHITWFPSYIDVNAKKTGMTKKREITRTHMGSSLLQKGDVQYALALKPQEGYEETVTVVTFHLLSTHTFEYIEDQKAIFNYQGTETDIAVPDNVDGMPVTQLWEKAFEEDAITSVVLPKNLSHLEAYDAQQETHGLLSGLEGLERVTIYKSTKGLPKGCIPAGVTICAPKGSEAEKYAKKHGHPFEPLK